MTDLSIYVHIPFCERKCLYCDFCSFSACEKEIENYFVILLREIAKRAKEGEGRTIKTIYFGGGTPSSVPSENIVSTLETIMQRFSVADNTEITIECNPCSVTKEKLTAYRNAGFNRISFGVQSFSDQVLSSLGRLHTGEQAEQAVKLAKEVGFDNISCDLMIGVPFQTQESLISDANRLADLGVNHISSYMLQLEEGTPLQRSVEKRELSVANDDTVATLYDDLVKELATLGFEQYEVSNFAKSKTYSQHNLNYWRRGEYLGFGLSAHSFLNETRFANSSIMEEYLEGTITQIERLTQQEIIEELVMLGLRCFEGVSIKKWKHLAGENFPKDKVEEFVKKKILYLDAGKAKLNPIYLPVNNEIICELIN